MANTTDLARRLAQRRGISKAAALLLMEDLLEVLGEALAEDGTVKLRGFGTLRRTYRSARRSYLVDRGAVGVIAARDTVRFQTSPQLLMLLNRGRRGGPEPKG